MNKLMTMKQRVAAIMENNPKTRDSDDILYYEVCKSIDGQYIDKPFWFVIQNRKKLGYPEFETIRRTRQKLQAEREDLAGSSAVRGFRKDREVEFREFAKS